VEIDRETARALLNAALSIHPVILGWITLVGLMAVFFGWRLLRALVVFEGAVAGAVAGMQFPLADTKRLAMVIALALIFALLSWFFYKAIVFVTAGLMGGAIAFVAVANLGLGSVWTVYLAVGISFACGGLLAMIFLRPISILVMSLIGAALVVEAGLIVCVKWYPKVGSMFIERDPKLRLILIVSMLVLAALGCALQWNGEKEKPDKKER